MSEPQPAHQPQSLETCQYVTGTAPDQAYAASNQAYDQDPEDQVLAEAALLYLDNLAWYRLFQIEKMERKNARLVRKIKRLEAEMAGIAMKLELESILNHMALALSQTRSLPKPAHWQSAPQKLEIGMTAASKHTLLLRQKVHVVKCYLRAKHAVLLVREAQVQARTQAQESQSQTHFAQRAFAHALAHVQALRRQRERVEALLRVLEAKPGEGVGVEGDELEVLDEATLGVFVEVLEVVCPEVLEL
ncbi:hypothetical protein EVG20_g460 [Dentipellis fragilis]|uniref:Uncharacterized protein n=1 Tax=Dentipellis fragilis TaxID=205917 RepID=A0A4Y9ZEY2_9AGAM|nr:hypothetical protein EVG20_g460 [Dentipellis fragilis]